MSLEWVHREAKNEEGLATFTTWKCLGLNRAGTTTDVTKQRKQRKRKNRSCVGWRSGKTKGRWINPVMACNQE